MVKKNLFLVFGLMSLITMSSCDDKITFNDDPEFLPVGYVVKSPQDTEELASGELNTLQIMGIGGLVFDEIQKDDWKIITQNQIYFKGNTPLEFDNNVTEIKNLKGLIDLPTNYDDISVAFGNTSVTYTYLGNQVELEPLEKVSLSISIQEEGTSAEPYFSQYGYIIYTLDIGYLPVKVHKQPFIILSGNNPDWNWVDNSDD